MEHIFKNLSKKIKIYLAVTTELDPIEHNVEENFLNPLPIRAIVTDLTAAKVQWSMPGIVADKVKEIIIEKKYENLLKQSYKIEIDNELYEGWKVNGKLQYRTEGSFIRAYVYIKKV